MPIDQPDRDNFSGEPIPPGNSILNYGNLAFKTNHCHMSKISGLQMFGLLNSQFYSTAMSNLLAK